MILYICSQQRCKSGGRAWLASLGFREAMAQAGGGAYQQHCPNCGAAMIEFTQDEPIMVSKLLIPDDGPERRSGRNRETKRKK